MLACDYRVLINPGVTTLGSEREMEFVVHCLVVSCLPSIENSECTDSTVVPKLPQRDTG